MLHLSYSPRRREKLLSLRDVWEFCKTCVTCQQVSHVYKNSQARCNLLLYWNLASNILIKNIFTRWGTPAYLVSNWGPQFTSQLFQDICKQWGVFQKLTTAYHPQTNLTERVNGNLTYMIAAYVKDNHWRWDRWQRWWWGWRMLQWHGCRTCVYSLAFGVNFGAV